MGEAHHKQNSIQHFAAGGLILLFASGSILALILFSIFSTGTLVTVFEGGPDVIVFTEEPSVFLTVLVFSGTVFLFFHAAIGLGLMLNSTWASPLAKLVYGLLFLLSLHQSHASTAFVLAVILALVFWGDPDTEYRATRC